MLFYFPSLSITFSPNQYNFYGHFSLINTFLSIFVFFFLKGFVGFLFYLMITPYFFFAHVFFWPFDLGISLLWLIIIIIIILIIIIIIIIVIVIVIIIIVVIIIII